MDKQVNKPKCVTSAKHGTKHWYLNGKLHREDGPAVIFVDGSKNWYLNGKLHREDGPAIIYDDGSKRWYLNDKRHREDGPADVWADGSKFWYLNDKLHREDGPAAIFAGGSKQWWLNDELIYNPAFCSFIIANKVEQKLFVSESEANKFMIEKLGEDVVAWINK